MSLGNGGSVEIQFSIILYLMMNSLVNEYGPSLVMVMSVDVDEPVLG